MYLPMENFVVVDFFCIDKFLCDEFADRKTHS